MSYIDKINRDGTDYDIQDSKAARSVEGTTASHVLQANEIYTATTQTQFEEFIFRTTGGDASLETGDAIIEAIFGGISKDASVPHTPESTTVTGTFANEETTVEINKDTWRGKVTTNGDYEFSYNGSNWQLDGSNVTLSQYGLTVTGTATSGDTIAVTYTRLSTGTLTVATPTSFVSTGFNQYDATAGYAHVVGGNQYRIAGTYTSLTFSETPTGSTSAVTVTNNRFIPEEDGYIHVVGGSGNILIALVWSGTMDNEPYSAYEESTITIPTKDAENNDLPTATYGLPGIGNIRDSISFTDKVYTQRIARLPYTIANLEMLEGVGAEYGTTMIYDASYIYYALQQPVVYQLADSTTDTYTANDFGTEEFRGTTVPIYTGLRYGNSLVDKLRNLVDIQEVGDGLEMDGSTIKTAHELNDDVPTGFFSGEAQVSGEGSEFTLEGTMSAKLKDVMLKGKSEQSDGTIHNLNYKKLDQTIISHTVSFVPQSDGTILISGKHDNVGPGNAAANLGGIFLPAGTYYMPPIEQPSEGYINWVLYNSNLGYINFSHYNNWSLTLDTAQSFSQFYVQVSPKVPQLNNFRVYPMVATTPITQNDYVPYTPFPSPESPCPIRVVTGSQKVTIKGKNLYDFKDTYSVTGDMSRTDDGWVTLHRNNTGTSTSYANYFTNPLELLPNTDYSIVVEIKDCTMTNSSSNYFAVVGSNDPTQFSAAYTLPASTQPGVYVQKVKTKADISESTIGLRSFMQTSPGSENSITFRISVLADTTITPQTFDYECGPQNCTIDLASTELCKMDDVQDYIYKNGNDWFMHKTMGKIVFDGSETFTKSSSTAADIFGYNMDNGDANDTTMVMSTHFPYSTSNVVPSCRKWNTMIYFVFAQSGTTDIAGFKSWLSSNNTTVYYKLRKPTNTKITDATLLTSLNSLAAMFGMDKKTDIVVSTTGTGLVALARVQAFKKNLAGIIASKI